MQASKLLEDSLDRLTAKLDELSADHPAELQLICDVLVNINARETPPDEFRSNLKELAEAVIAIRTRPGSPARFRELPVPPYDLWLPFKAEDLTPSDSEDLVEAMRIFNHKVSELASRHGCSDETQEERQCESSPVMEHKSNESH